MSPIRTHLLIIDPQNDFCDQPESLWPLASNGARTAPALPVTGAHADMLRLAAFIRSAGTALDAITVTLDSHQHIDIGHPTFWQHADGTPVLPFTQICARDVREGRFVPRQPSARPRVQQYLETLEAAGRYTHMVWPVHCEIGSWGHAVHEAVRSAYNAWEERTLATVTKVAKGTNPWTEHYSAIQAEVPDPADPNTQSNAALIGLLRASHTLIIAGEAGSHCVKATTEHIVAKLDAEAIQRIVILSDCISAVTGFETQYAAFLDDMRARGARIMSATELAAALTR